MKKAIFLILSVMLWAATSAHAQGTGIVPAADRIVRMTDTAAGTCTAGKKGKIYHSLTDNKVRECDGTTWNVIATGSSGLVMGTTTSDGTSNVVLKTNASGKVTNSTITDDGTTVTTPSTLSLTATGGVNTPQLNFGTTTTGIYVSANVIGHVYGGVYRWVEDNPNNRMVGGSQWQYTWSTNPTDPNATLDTGIARASAGEVQVTNGSSGIGNLSIGNLKLQDDTSPSNFLIITDAENLTADHTLSLNSNNADRTVSLSGNLTVSSAATISGTNTGDQTIPGGNNCSNFNVSGSDATTTGQSLVDITGLVTGTLAISSNYIFNATLYVTTSAVTTGTQYGTHISVAPTRTAANYIGPTTVSSNLQTMQTSGTNADNIASAAFLTTASEEGVVQISGFFTTAGSGSPVFSLRHLKNTSGTSTVKVGSQLTVCKQ